MGVFRTDFLFSYARKLIIPLRVFEPKSPARITLKVLTAL